MVRFTLREKQASHAIPALVSSFFYVYLMVISESRGKAILPQSQPHHLVITALGVDRPGIVNTITRHVSSCGCNIEDSRLAMLGDEFTFIMLLSGSWNAITLIESTLPLKGAELELLIVMKRTNARLRPPMPDTAFIQVEVADSPHIIERFTDLIDKHQMNVAELVSRITPAQHNLPPTLYIQMTAHSPTRTSGTPFEQAFNTLCQELNAKGTLRLYSVSDADSSESVSAVR
ncbi:glycine cleavage system transcriptional repressor [Pantoea agglomerans]|nr:glycine cleavage system transcriptional repressor [Pantoea agglomerans]MBD8184048.1 glycine cleavage system transcriptional repressor [Pantoea agglomerans]MBD8222969.1 glycine cleavage system transcriptional repressor [Pantoea agglomerans]QTC51525.1 glycine cleavage system transcriptional repressor [Pantoea agglomerans]